MAWLEFNLIWVLLYWSDCIYVELLRYDMKRKDLERLMLYA